MSQAEQFNDRKRLQAEKTGQREAMRAAIEKQTEHINNPNFIAEIGDPEADSELYDWLEAEFGPEFAKGQILGKRDEDYPRQRGLLDANLTDRYIVERSPGRILRQHPKLNALMQGIRGTAQYPDPTDHPMYREPPRSDDKRIIRSAANLMTTFKSLAAEGFGLESATTATTEHRTVDRQEETAGGIRGKVKEVFR